MESTTQSLASLIFLWFRVSFMESLKFRDSLKFGDFIPKFATLKFRVFFPENP